MRRFSLFVILAAAVAGCSALIDSSEFQGGGGGMDAGVDSGMDGGTPDTSRPDTGIDTGTGCPDPFEAMVGGECTPCDQDGDGYFRDDFVECLELAQLLGLDDELDCDDGNDTVYPFAPTFCDGADHSCGLNPPQMIPGFGEFGLLPLHRIVTEEDPGITIPPLPQLSVVRVNGTTPSGDDIDALGTYLDGPPVPGGGADIHLLAFDVEDGTATNVNLGDLGAIDYEDALSAALARTPDGVRLASLTVSGSPIVHLVGLDMSGSPDLLGESPAPDGAIPNITIASGAPVSAPTVYYRTMSLDVYAHEEGAFDPRRVTVNRLRTDPASPIRSVGPFAIAATLDDAVFIQFDRFTNLNLPAPVAGRFGLAGDEPAGLYMGLFPIEAASPQFATMRIECIDPSVPCEALLTDIQPAPATAIPALAAAPPLFVAAVGAGGPGGANSLELRFFDQEANTVQEGPNPFIFRLLDQVADLGVSGHISDVAAGSFRGGVGTEVVIVFSVFSGAEPSSIWSTGIRVCE